MILFICAGCYLIIGVFLNFFHPEITELKPVLRSVNHPTNDYIELGRYNPRWKRITAILLIRFVIILIGPATSLIEIITNAIKKGRKIILREYEEEDYNYLYLSNIAGAGEVSCMLCSYSIKLTGKVNGGPGSDWNLKGYQCQSCGQFHQIENPEGLYCLPRCDCGGEISRGEFVFCPKCRCDHMNYTAQYVDEQPAKPDIYRNLIFPG